VGGIGLEIYLRDKDKDLPMASLYLPNKGLYILVTLKYIIIT